MLGALFVWEGRSWTIRRHRRDTERKTGGQRVGHREEEAEWLGTEWRAGEWSGPTVGH